MTFNTIQDMLVLPPRETSISQGQEGGEEEEEEERNDDEKEIDDTVEFVLRADDNEEYEEYEEYDEGDEEGSVDDDLDVNIDLVGRYVDDSSLLALELSHLRDSQVAALPLLPRPYYYYRRR